MSAYVAFPAHLLDELLAFLPSDERPVYAERFERIVGDLVWLREDAQNAVEAALADSDDPAVSALRFSLGRTADARGHTDGNRDNDALTTLVQDALTTLATDLVRQAAMAARSHHDLPAAK